MKNKPTVIEKAIEEAMDMYMWKIKQYKTIRNYKGNLPFIIEQVVNDVARLAIKKLNEK